MPLSQKRALWLAGAIAAAGWLISFVTFYPGLFTPDSLDQFEQARTGAFSDWHPPVMAALWYVLHRLHDGPVLLFAVHLALFWGGVWAFAAGLSARGLRYSALFPLIGLLPFVFNYLGLLWKDVALMAAWTFAIGFFFWGQSIATASVKRAITAVAWAGFIYGALARANSIFAAAPLALYLLGGDLIAGAQIRRWTVLTLTPLAAWVAAAALAGPLLHAEREHPLASLQAFDIVGIAHFSGADVIPGKWHDGELSRVDKCYRPDKWDHLSEGPCSFFSDELEEKGYWGTPALTHAWIGAITAHPGAYLAHRLGNLNALLRWRGPLPSDDLFLESEITDPLYANQPGWLFRRYEDVCNTLAATPLFRPYFWLILSLGAAALSFSAAPSDARRAATAVSTSGAIYVLTYLVVGVGADFRYAYWTIVSTLTAGAALLACRWRSAAAARVTLTATGAVLAAAIAASVFS